MPSSLKTAWRDPWVRWPTLGLFGLAGVIIMSWIVIDQMGRRAWRKAEVQIAADGESLDFRGLLHPPIPDEENFCAIPILRNVGAPKEDLSPAGREGERNRERLRTADYSTVIFKNEGTPRIYLHDSLDVETLAANMRKEARWKTKMPEASSHSARDIQAALADWEPIFEEVAAGLPRPRARWTPDFGTKLAKGLVATPTPESIAALKLAQALSLRARLAARTGDVGKVLQSVRIIERLNEAMYEQPLLICDLVGMADEAIVVSAVWELSQTQLGSELEWSELERLFAAIHFQKTTLYACRGEFSADLDAFLSLRESRELNGLESSLFGVSRGGRMLLRFAPPGFFEGMAAERAREQLRMVIRPLRDGSVRGLLAGARAGQEAASREPPVWALSERIAKAFSFDYGPVLLRSLCYQARANQAVIACVLERARLRTGAYPESLDGLTLSDGRPLPKDPITDRSMHYRRDRKRYVLWSIGIDEKDDGGTRDPRPLKELSLEHHGDWVWSYAE